MNDKIENDMDLPKVGYTFLPWQDSNSSCWRKYNRLQKAGDIKLRKYLLRQTK